ncbi:MAG: hypothetical protein HY746_02345, partial [Elusimicrobia bacterium]|nr:hypothetical protein [Elusimicrobiota bacterium]
LEREYNLRLENAVQAQTEHVFDDLDFLRRRNDELSRTLKFKEEELESVKGDLASVERKWSEKMRNLERDVIAGKAAEIEEQFRQEKAKIEAQYQGRADELEQEYLRKCGELDKTFEYKCELLNQEMSDLKNTAAFLRKELSASQVKINELENEVILRERAAAENAGRALSEKLKITEQHLLRAEEEYKKELAACYAKFNELEDELMSNRREYKEDLDRKEKIHLEETDVKIRGAVSRATEAMSEKLRMAEEALMSLEDESRREITGLHERLGQVENELISRQREYQEKTAQAEKTHMEEMDMKVKEAVSKAVEALSDKLRIAEEELIRIAEDSRKEVTFLEDSFRSEKERLLEEIERREKQIEALLSEQMDGSAREKQFREQITNCEKQMADKEIQMAEHKRNIEKGYIKKMAEIEEL